MITFKIAEDGAESFEVTAQPRDVLLWERSVRGAKFDNFTTPSFEDIYGLAYFACKRQRVWDGNRKDFEDRCDVKPIEEDEDYEPGEEDTDTGPTAEDR
jgi:hypothetical protein